MKMERAPGTEHYTKIDSIAPSEGFVVNGKHHKGALLAFNTHSMEWKAPKGRATYESLSFIPFVKPKIEFLILGTGRLSDMPDPQLKKHLQSHDIEIEPMPTEHAVSTFNMMMCDDRNVAVALPVLTKEEHQQRAQHPSATGSSTNELDDVDAFLAGIMDVAKQAEQTFEKQQEKMRETRNKLHGSSYKQFEEQAARSRAQFPDRHKRRTSGDRGHEKAPTK